MHEDRRTRVADEGDVSVNLHNFVENPRVNHYPRDKILALAYCFSRGRGFITRVVRVFSPSRGYFHPSTMIPKSNSYHLDLENSLSWLKFGSIYDGNKIISNGPILFELEAVFWKKHRNAASARIISSSYDDLREDSLSEIRTKLWK